MGLVSTTSSLRSQESAPLSAGLGRSEWGEAKGQAARWDNTYAVQPVWERYEILCEEMAPQVTYLHCWHLHICLTLLYCTPQSFPKTALLCNASCVILRCFKVTFTDVMYCLYNFPFLGPIWWTTKLQFCCHLIKRREEGRCLVLVTFLYSVDFVLYNDASECHAPVCSDEAYPNKCQEQGRMS